MKIYLFFLRSILFQTLFYPQFVLASVEPFSISPSAGKEIVSFLRSTVNNKSTTSSRKEQKTVLKRSVFEKQLKIVQQTPASKRKIFSKKRIEKLKFSDRDVQPKGGKNVTFTLYGKGMYFMNLGVKTTVKLRARFYLQRFEKNNTIIRSPGMEHLSFLELKIKNPSPEEIGSVEKYRIKIPDEQLCELFELDPLSNDYTHKLRKIRDESLAFSKQAQKKPAEAKALFATIAKLSKIDKDFKRPVIGISYERTAKKYLEKKYLSKKYFFRRNIANNMEYQLTIDQNIVGYKPTIDSFKSFSFIDYIRERADNDIVYVYPKDALVVELKVPLYISDLKSKRRSWVHQNIIEKFSSVLYTQDSTYEGFILNKGKAGTIRKKII